MRSNKNLPKSNRLQILSSQITGLELHSKIWLPIFQIIERLVAALFGNQILEAYKPLLLIDIAKKKGWKDIRAALLKFDILVIIIILMGHNFEYFNIV